MTLDGSERCVLSITQPQCVQSVGVARGEAQAGEFGLGVEFVGDLVTFGYGQLIRADRGKGVLCIDIKGSDVFFISLLHGMTFFLVFLIGFCDYYCIECARVQ